MTTKQQQEESVSIQDAAKQFAHQLNSTLAENAPGNTKFAFDPVDVEQRIVPKMQELFTRMDVDRSGALQGKELDMAVNAFNTMPTTMDAAKEIYRERAQSGGDFKIEAQQVAERYALKLDGFMDTDPSVQNALPKGAETQRAR